MSFDSATEFLDELPAPCVYLAHDETIAYANVAASKIIQRQPEPQTPLKGCLIHETNFTREHIVDASELDSALEELRSHAGKENLRTRDGVDNTRNTFSLQPRQGAITWCWRLSRTIMRSGTYFCLIAHPSSTSTTQKHRTGQYEMLQHVAKPTFDADDHLVTLFASDLSSRSMNEFGRKELGVLADQVESMDIESKEWLVYDEDFTKQLSMTDAGVAVAYKAGKGSLSGLSGIENPATGARSIIDSNVVLLNDPLSDGLLGCIVQARPAQEWAEFLVRHDMAAQTSSKTLRPTMLRTILLDGRIDFFSPSWEDYTGHNSKVLCKGGWSDCVHPGDRADLEKWTKAAITSEQRQEYEVRYRESVSGEFRSFKECLAPWRNAEGRVTRYYFITTDIHELASQRRAAGLASERLYNIVQNMDVTIFEIDANYVIKSAEGALQIDSPEGSMQHPRVFAEMHLSDAIQAINPEGIASLSNGVDDILTGRMTKAMVEYQIGPKYLRTILVPIKDDSTTADTGVTITGALGLTFDYTAQLDNQQAAIQIQAMKQSGQMKDEFLANISHELRTPIAGLLGLLNLLLETELSAAQLDLTYSLQASATDLSRIVNDLLDYSKAHADAMLIEKTPFTLHDVISDLTKSNEILALRKSLRLEIEPVEVGACPALLGDALRVRQILQNLLNNAIKFTETGFVRLSTTLQRVQDSRIAVQMRIQDSGIGIDEDTLKRLFKPFVQADQSTTRLYGGTGLGLSIARKLAQAMNGDVSLTSIKGQGTTSTLSIIFELDPSSPQEQKIRHNGHFNQEMKPESPVAMSLDLDQISILVVEDNAINQKVITGILRNLGINKVSWATHGEEAVMHMTAALAIESVADTQHVSDHAAVKQILTPDLIFMDCQMPVLDGFAATRQIRSSLQYRGPIIALTASAIQGYRQKCLDAGMDDYITKPFTKLEIKKVLEQWLRKS